jgi:predicted acyltransferase
MSQGFANIPMAGVLHRIGVAYFFAALIFCFCRSARPLAVITGLLLIGYWLLMTFIPVPTLVPRGGPPGFWPAYHLDWSHLSSPSYAQGKSLAYAIDQAYMPGAKFEGTILSTPAAVANALLGVLAGLFLRFGNVAPERKGYYLMLAGFVSTAVGIVWGLQFPIIKVLWTSSYVLVACGLSAILLGIFYQVIDVWRYQRWATPFVWIGTNAITIYLVSAIVGFQKVAKRFVGGDIAEALGNWADFVRCVVALIMVFAVCRFLYRRQLFLRL